MAACITCGTELHPERALKYDYCTAPECQEKNLKGLTMVAIGMNKAADEFLLLDEQASADLASGKYRDQRRGTFGPTAPAAPVVPSAGRAPQRRPGAGVWGSAPAKAHMAVADVSRLLAMAISCHHTGSGRCVTTRCEPVSGVDIGGSRGDLPMSQMLGRPPRIGRFVRGKGSRVR